MPQLTQRRVRVLAHILCLIPLAILAAQWGQMVAGSSARETGLSSEPVAYTINNLGLWTLRILLLTLCISPLRQWVKRPEIAAARRPLGLWAFAYGVTHLAIYFGLDLGFSIGELFEEISEHVFILFGIAALTALVPLAATSTQAMMRKMGRNWRRLHMLVYPAVIFAGVHFIYRVKGFQWEPWIYTALAAALIILRLPVVKRGLGLK